LRVLEPAVQLRGCVRVPGEARRACLADIAEAIRAHYLHHGELPVKELEGTFTVALLDGREGRVVLYRHLGGTGFVYYCTTPSGLLFANNLADLVDTREESPAPNANALPAYFLYRWVPGRETLFDRVYRLMPGEQLTWSPRQGLRLSFRQTMDELHLPEPPRGDLIARVEATLTEILTDYAALRPATGNLLSGGVDSSYLQLLWKRAARPGEVPLSFSADVDHAAGRREMEYALSAARLLGTCHTAVAIEGPYADYLLDTIGGTGEPPNHVQSAYFAPMARAMVARGVTTGLCGDGADSQFGLTLANQVHYARLLRCLLPLAPLRSGLAWAATALGWGRLHEHLWLANHLHDHADERHPLNQITAYTDWEAVRACFGTRALDAAAAERRTILTGHGIPDNLLVSSHMMCFLADALDTAALWTTLFNREGAEMLLPFQDSRLIRLANSLGLRQRFPFRHPKKLLKTALVRHGLREIAYRPKQGFGQPIFEWLAPGGQLRPWVESIGEYPFVDQASLGRARARPSWFLYSLLCYDVWHKLFIDRSLPRRPRRRRAHEALAR
jgi:asparagine synthase (glutamine-hydrolysing)